MRRLIAMMLVLCMAVPFAACRKENEEVPDTSSSGHGTNDPIFDESEYLASLPDVKYDSDFHVLCTIQTGSAPENFYDVTEESSDTVASAVYRRNLAVEERYLITLIYHALEGNRGGANAFATEIRTSAESGSGYDLIIGQNYYVLPTATEGYLQNLLDSDYFHWDEVWYNASINEHGIINNNLYGASGTYIMSQISYAMAIFFNKDFFDAGQHAYDLYELARNHEWTYEVLYELSADYYTDEGTLGIVDDQDVFGYVYNSHGVENSILASDCPIVYTNSDGTLTIDDYYSTHLIKVFNDYYSFFNESAGTRRFADDFTPTEQLGGGKALFANSRIGMMIVCDEMRNSDYRIGVLPMPMYDTAQRDYYTGTMRWELFYIPINADLEKSSIVLEYLNYTSEKYVLPAYWDNAIFQKADEAKDAEMLELVRSSLYYDFASFFGFAMGGIYGGPVDTGGVKKLIEDGNPGLSSWWSANRETFRQALADVLEDYG